MPSCPRCGSYYIRPPCPVCSPPGEEQLIEDSKEQKGKSIEELQLNLKEMQEKLRKGETEIENRIQDLKTQLDVTNDRVENLELVKVSTTEKINSIKKESANLEEELKNLEIEIESLEREKSLISDETQKAEENISNLDSEIMQLKEQIELRKREEEQQDRGEESEEVSSAEIETETSEGDQ